MTPYEYIENNQKKLIQSLQEMVRIATVNPPGYHYLDMVDALEKHCGQLGMDVKVHRVPDRLVEEVTGASDYPRYNLIARWDVGAATTVHFNAHYDVVPVMGQWKFGDPFAPALSNGAIYGRGSGDMKGSIAALLAAVEALQRTRCEPAFNIECSFTADEETGGELGAGYVVRQGLVDADYAVVCEGASGLNVGYGHNGVLWLEVEIRGRPAHAASPHLGVNAFEAMAHLVQGMQDIKKQLAAPVRSYRDYTGQERNPTINIGGVFGGGQGDKVNTVPARAVFSIDRRIVPNESLKQVERELRQTLNRLAKEQTKGKCSVRSPLRIVPCMIDPQLPLPQAFTRAVQSVRRRPAGFRATTGFTDLHYFVEEGGLPGIGYGVKGEQGHGIDERVKVRDLVQTARTYAEFMLREIREV